MSQKRHEHRHGKWHETLTYILFLAHSQTVIHLHDDAHCAFVTLFPYISTREDKVQPLVLDVMRHPIHVWCLVKRVGPELDAHKEETSNRRDGCED